MSQKPNPSPAQQPRPGGHKNFSAGEEKPEGRVAEMGGQGLGTERKDVRKKPR